MTAVLTLNGRTLRWSGGKPPFLTCKLPYDLVGFCTSLFSPVNTASGQTSAATESLEASSVAASSASLKPIAESV